MKTKILTGIVLLFITSTSFSQSTIELLGPPGAGGPAGRGASTANQTVSLFINGTTPHNPPVTATYYLSNQQFTSIEGNPTTPGVVFGSNNPSSLNPNLVATPVTGGELLYPFMNVVGNPQSTHFTACNSCTPGTGIVVGTNRAIEMHPLADALIDAANNNLYPLTARVWFADLTITFNRPVSNPVLHFGGIGGEFFYTSSNNKYYNHGYATEFDLLTTGVTLKRLSGSVKFDVIGNTVKDTAASLGYNAMGATLNGTMRYGAAGSVAVLGTNITTLTFRVFVKGDAGNVTNGTTTTTPDAGFDIKWAPALAGVLAEGGLYGDAMTIGLSLQDPVNISGTVFNDPDAGNVNNSSGATNVVPSGMYINLVDTNNVVVASVPVATDGRYTFSAIFEGTYTTVLSASNLSQGATPVASSVPASWQSTGEYNGIPNTGNDGTINGTSAAFVVGATDVSNINFAIKPASALPVTFADFFATISNNQLTVKWSTLSETNNSHFEVEASVDGKNFTKIGTIESKATNGNSSIPLHYVFNQDNFSNAFVLGGGIMALLGLCIGVKKRKWNILAMAIWMSSIQFFVGCSKSGSNEIQEKNIYIRLVQVDKDGAKSYSKVIKVNNLL